MFSSGFPDFTLATVRQGHLHPGPTLLWPSPSLNVDWIGDQPANQCIGYILPTIICCICVLVYSYNRICDLGSQFSRGLICRTNIFQGPNLPGPDLPGPNLPPRGPICRGPICRGPICHHQIFRGPICRTQNFPGPNLPGPNLPGPNLPGPNLPRTSVPGVF